MGAFLLHADAYIGRAVCVLLLEVLRQARIMLRCIRAVMMARQPNEKLLKNFLKLLESESIRCCLQISSELKN